ncbi:MAG: DEAD/DEAH box helicase, partial [Desulfurococcaceae archaeon]
MANAYADLLTVELNEYLLRMYSAHDTRVVYERIDKYSEPELGPYVEDLDLPNTLLEVLEKRGIRRLYRFQYEAYRNIIGGRNVFIASGTGTGKTEAFYIPLANRVIEEEKPNPRAMLLYPTKALARDQVNRFREYNVYGKLGVGIYDGDTPKRLRSRTAASLPPILVSNPDIIHLGLIYSQHITRFIDSSDVLVFDELHNYEGVLGSYLHHLIRRIKLTRGEETQFIVSSATIGNPKEFARSIFDEDFVEIRG